MTIRHRPSLTRFEALIRVFECYGSTQEAVAEALGVSQSTVSRMLSQSKQLRHDLVLKAEEDTGISRHDLRPDIYPREAMVDMAIASRWNGLDRRAASRMTG